MAVDWRGLLGGLGSTLGRDQVEVKLGNGRVHRVAVTEVDGGLLVVGRVAKAGKLKEYKDIPLQIWMRNRLSSIVGFRLDKSGHLWGEAWLPMDGLQDAEKAVCIRQVAQECDRWEYLLTGRAEY